MSDLRRRSVLAGASGLAATAVLPWSAVGAPTGAPDTADGGLPLVSGGRASARILWYGKGSAPFAARELSTYAHRMTGVRLPVAEAEEPAGGLPDGVTGVVALRPTGHGGGGDGTLPAAQLAEAGGELSGGPADSFALLVSAEAAVLTGLGDRAPLYAVYALLEQAGVRFFAPQFAAYEGHGERVPRASGFTARAQRRTERPSWELRRQYAEEGFSHTRRNLPQLLDWMAKNRLNTLVFPTDYLGLGVTTYDSMRAVVREEAALRGVMIETGGHGYDSFLPPEEYPQFYTSGGPLFDIFNPEALDAYVEKVVAYLQERPEVTVFDCWPPDVPAFQKEILDRYGTASNAESVVVNKLAAVVKERLPGVRVERIAYSSTLAPPDPEYATSPGVLVDFAPIGRTYQASLGDPDSEPNAEQAAHLRAWREGFRGTLSMYEYYRRYRWRSRPVHPLATIAGDVAFEAKLGVDGIGMYCEPGDWVPYEHVQNLVAALAWDTSLDTDGYLDGYLEARFGARASGAVRRYFAATETDPDSTGASALRTHYLRAEEALEEAGRNTRDEGARLVVDRLLRNVRTALADTEIDLAGEGGDAGGPEVARARRAYRVRVLRNRFTGACLPNAQVTARWVAPGEEPPYDDAESRRATAEAYRAPAAGFTDPEELTVRRGTSATVAVEAQDVDFTGHTVHWRAEAPDGVTLVPGEGALRVKGTRTAAQELTLTADSAATGEHTVALGLRLADGTELPGVALRLTVTDG